MARCASSFAKASPYAQPLRRDKLADKLLDAASPRSLTLTLAARLREARPLTRIATDHPGRSVS